MKNSPAKCTNKVKRSNVVYKFTWPYHHDTPHCYIGHARTTQKGWRCMSKGAVIRNIWGLIRFILIEDFLMITQKFCPPNVVLQGLNCMKPFSSLEKCLALICRKISPMAPYPCLIVLVFPSKSIWRLAPVNLYPQLLMVILPFLILWLCSLFRVMLLSNLFMMVILKAPPTKTKQNIERQNLCSTGKNRSLRCYSWWICFWY